MSDPPFDTDVLVVGAGPTGLMLANQLARRGIRVTIVDRHAEPARETRALGVQARTLEIYTHLGIVERALSLGKIATGANIWADGRHMARVTFGDAGRGATPYPYILILGQDDNERLMGEHLRGFDVDVQWNTELTGMTERHDGVEATVKTPEGTRTLRARFIGGCDGAHSAVRRLTGITFPGAPYEHVFFVADTELTGTMVPDEVNVYLWRSGFHLFFPMRGQDHWRLVGILPAELRDRPDVRFEDVVPSLQKEAGEGIVFRRCSWLSTYRIHHRAASHFRSGRCFLLGDAAHIHSPVGAQGMNTGLQDAYNLAWKLACVIRDGADERLLDSYEAERLPVARRLLQTTDRAFRLVVASNALAGLVRTQVIARVAAFGMSRTSVQAAAFRVVSQTGIHYRDSALSRTRGHMPAGAPRAGDRFPWLRVERADGSLLDSITTLDDAGFQLLVFGAGPAIEIGAALGIRVTTIASGGANGEALARAHVPSPSFYLLRPDGHVGLCGLGEVDAAAVRAYAAEVIGVRASRGDGEPVQ